MCGIVGYIGPKNSLDVVMEGLRRLEYRGYDSSGVCVLSPDPQEGLKIYKAVGKIENLSNLLKDKNVHSPIGIGHTRWATHGKVVQENAHPHGNSDVAIVHNGIIENSAELKEMLIKEGHQFLSQTDTEVFFVLVMRFKKMNLDLKTAVSEAFKCILGNSAFVVMDRTSSEIITVKRSAPIVCGTSSDNLEAYVSSDPYALVGYADKLYFPENEVLCVLRPRTDNDPKISFFELDGSESHRVMVKDQNKNLTINDKGDFEHFMLKEIHEQPQLIRQFIHNYMEGEGRRELMKVAGKEYPRLYISACGTAWHAGLVMKEFFEKYNRIPTQVELASEFRYRDPLINKEDLGLFISQSGETADTLAANELCAAKGMDTFGIVNVEGSTLYRQCSENFLIHAGVEIGVAWTKAFTLQVLTGLMLSHGLNNRHDDMNIRHELHLLADRIDEILNHQIQHIQNIAKELYCMKGYIFTARGKYYPVALEGALKLKEIAYVHAEGYAAGELKHGPIALIDSEMVNVAIVGPELFDKALSNVQEVKARNGVIVGIGPENSKHLKEICDYFIPLNFTGLNDTAPLYANVVSQLLSYYIAKFKGTDIDRPRNLAKSVTVE